jgi:predicted transcriptional regulator
MSTQIAVRFPDEIAERMQEVVSAGWAPTRTALIQTAVEREIRRAHATRDRAILEQLNGEDDLDALADWVASHGGSNA